jgi:hypothetical protein
VPAELDRADGGADESGVNVVSRFLDSNGRVRPEIMAELQHLADDGAPPSVVARKLLDDIGGGFILFHLVLRSTFGIPLRDLRNIESWEGLARATNPMSDAELDAALAPWINRNAAG